MIRDKSNAEMFAYTGSFSVYAAAGGAIIWSLRLTCQIPINWAKRNFELNGFSDEKIRFIVADVMSFWKQTEKQLLTSLLWTLPTFSNSKKMEEFWISKEIMWNWLMIARIFCRRKVFCFSLAMNFTKFEIDSSKINASIIKRYHPKQPIRLILKANWKGGVIKINK